MFLHSREGKSSRLSAFREVKDDFSQNAHGAIRLKINAILKSPVDLLETFERGRQVAATRTRLTA